MNWAGESPGTITAVHCRSAGQNACLVADVAAGVATWSVRVGIRATCAVARTLQPLTDLAARPPLLPERYWPGHLMHMLADAGRAQRRGATLAALRYFRELASCLAAAIDLPEIIRTSTNPPNASQDLPIRSIEADDAVAAWVDRVFHR